MDRTCDISEAEAALKARRERIRAYADRVLEAVETMDMPVTLEEAGRATRVATGLDRLYVRLYSEIKLYSEVKLYSDPRLALNHSPAIRAPKRIRGPEPVPEPTPEEKQAKLEASAKLLEEKLFRFVDSRRPENQFRPYAAPEKPDGPQIRQTFGRNWPP